MEIFMQKEPQKKYVNDTGTLLVSLYLLAAMLVGMSWLGTQLRSLPPSEGASTTPANPPSPATAETNGQAAARAPSISGSIPQPLVVLQAAQSTQTDGNATSQSQEATGQPAGDQAQGTRQQEPPGRAAELASTAVLAAAGGSLGGSLHALRSLWWYAGHRQLLASWLPMYLLLPFGSALLAVIVCLVLGAGFWDTGPAQDNVGQILAVAVLVGLFSDRAARMLEKVADVVFSTKDKGADHQPIEGIASSAISVAQHPTADASAQPLTIKAAGFTLPVAVWLTDPGGAVAVREAQPTPGAADSYDVSAVLATPGAWTVRLSDANGKTSADLKLDVQ
jgi:hypothetical protein